MTAIFAMLVTEEARGRIPRMTAFIIEIAARRLPDPIDAERYREEWLAELHELRETPLTLIATALRIAVRSRRVGRAMTAPSKQSTTATQPVREPFDWDGVSERHPHLARLLERTRLPTWDDYAATMRTALGDTSVDDDLDAADERLALTLSDADGRERLSILITHTSTYEDRLPHPKTRFVEGVDVVKVPHHGSGAADMVVQSGRNASFVQVKGTGRRQPRPPETDGR
ncbi:MAG TPA: hypothetical protein VI318_26700 [Baekduia sp.]